MDAVVAEVHIRKEAFIKNEYFEDVPKTNIFHVALRQAITSNLLIEFLLPIKANGHTIICAHVRIAKTINSNEFHDFDQTETISIEKLTRLDKFWKSRRFWTWIKNVERLVLWSRREQYSPCMSHIHTPCRARWWLYISIKLAANEDIYTMNCKLETPYCVVSRRVDITNLCVGKFRIDQLLNVIKVSLMKISMLLQITHLCYREMSQVQC